MIRSLQMVPIGITLILVGPVVVESKLQGGGCDWGPLLTLSRQLADSDAAYLVKWITRTEFGVQAVMKPGAPNFRPNSIQEFDHPQNGKPDTLCLLLGRQENGSTIWSKPILMSPASCEYLRQAPEIDNVTANTPPSARLKFFIPYLEHPDSVISEDAYRELEQAPHDDLAQLADLLPRQKLRMWLQSEETSLARHEMYGILLGLCGADDDAEFLERIIVQKTEEFRLGIEGVMAGYLLLTGEKGLAVIEETKLRNREAVFSEVYGALNALRFMNQHASLTIPRERLRISMRLLLDRPELADLVILELMRMKDWESQDRVMELYGADEYDMPSIKRAIVRFLLVSENAKPPLPQSEPDHVIQARKYLAQLVERDPKTVKDAKRFLKNK